MNPEINSGFISLLEAAKKLGTSRDYVNVLVRRGKLKARKIGRNWATTEEWINQYLAARVKNSPPSPLFAKEGQGELKFEFEKLRLQHELELAKLAHEENLCKIENEVRLREVEKDEKVGLANVGAPITPFIPITPVTPLQSFEELLQEQINKVTHEAQSKIESIQSEKQELASFFAKQLEEIKQQLNQSPVAPLSPIKPLSPIPPLKRAAPPTRLPDGQANDDPSPAWHLHPLHPHGVHYIARRPIAPVKPFFSFRFSLPNLTLPRITLPKLQPKYLTIGASALAVILLVIFARNLSPTLSDIGGGVRVRWPSHQEILSKVKGNIARLAIEPFARIVQRVSGVKFSPSGRSLRQIPKPKLQISTNIPRLEFEFRISDFKLNPDPLAAKLTEFRISNIEYSLNSEFSTLYSSEVAGAFTQSIENFWDKAANLVLDALPGVKAYLVEVSTFLASSFGNVRIIIFQFLY